MRAGERRDTERNLERDRERGREDREYRGGFKIHMSDKDELGFRTPDVSLQSISTQ